MRVRYSYCLLLVATLFFASCSTAKKTGTSTSSEVVEVISEPVEVPNWASKADQHPYRPSATMVFDLVHTKLEVDFDWERQYLNGKATITVTSHFYSQDSLVLDAKGYDIKEVRLMRGEEAADTLPYLYDGQKLSIALGQQYSREDTLTVFIDYVAKPNELKSGGGEAITDDKGLYFINPDGAIPGKPKQIWTQGETESSSAWFPTIEATNQKMTQEIYMTVDTGYVTLSNGLLIYSHKNGDGTRTDYWKQELPHAPYLVMMAVGDFAIVKDKWRDLPVNYYMEREYAPHAKAVFGNTPEMLDFFSGLLNYDYPWEKYSQIVVRDYVSGAMENTSASLFIDALNTTSRELLDRDWDFIIAHELFHQWFGDLVTAESWANLALNEAFANYSEYLWAEYKHGQDEADHHGASELSQYLNESRSKQEPIIRYHHGEPLDMFDSHSYAKGGRVLHMLRSYLGDEAFFTALNLYLTRHEFGSAELANLRLAMEEVSGKDLNWFFNQWFLSPGHPQLEVSENYANGVFTVTVKQVQDTLYTPIYTLPIKFSYWVDGKRTDEYVIVDGAEFMHSRRFAKQPELFVFDTDQQILGTVRQDWSKGQLVMLYKRGSNYGMKQNALMRLRPEDGSDVDQIYFTALSDDFWFFRELGAAHFEDYVGAMKPQVISKLKDMAVNDPKSSVRATALSVLSDIDKKQAQSVASKAFSDSSYMVIGAAIEAYSKSGASDANKRVEKFASSEQPTIVLAMAEHYISSGDTTRLDWFISRFKKIDSPLAALSMASQLGKYALGLSEAKREKAADALASVASEDASSMYARYGAFQAMGLLENDRVRQKREQIAENEKDERLKQLFKQMLGN